MESPELLVACAGKLMWCGRTSLDPAAHTEPYASAALLRLQPYTPQHLAEYVSHAAPKSEAGVCMSLWEPSQTLAGQEYAEQQLADLLASRNRQFRHEVVDGVALEREKQRCRIIRAAKRARQTAAAACKATWRCFKVHYSLCLPFREPPHSPVYQRSSSHGSIFSKYSI